MLSRSSRATLVGLHLHAARRSAAGRQGDCLVPWVSLAGLVFECMRLLLADGAWRPSSGAAEEDAQIVSGKLTERMM